jgi:phosphatidylserine/phosphatidylglycerophosphate/cardiolipin synthase-like enzyme
MGIQIILRQDASTSYFKRYFLALVQHTSLTELLICSGYFQEDLWGYSVLADDLLYAIQNHANKSKIKLIVVGGKFQSRSGVIDQWEVAYHKFVYKVQQAGISYDAYLAKKNNWHAKIAIARGQKKFIGAIVGSSNLTRPAFEENYNKFNFECDVVLFPDKEAATFSNKSDSNNDSPFAPIVAELARGVSQANELSRIEALYKEVLDLDDLEEFRLNKEYL